MEEQKLLPMISEPYYYLLTAKRYDFPPTIGDGGRKAVLIRDIINPYTRELLGGYQKGTMGMVIPINEHNLQNMFIEHQEWMQKGISIYSKTCERLDKSYDFFRYGTHRKTGKYEPTHWHTYISRFDFEYVNEKEKIEEKKETIQLAFDFF